MKFCYLNIATDMKPDNDASLAAYASKVGPMFGSKGAELVLRVRTREQLEGAPPQVLTVLRFPNVEIIHNILSSDAYKQLLPLRDEAFSNVSMAITEDFMPVPGAAQ